MKKVDAELPKPPPKFQANIKVQLNTARFPDYLSVSYDYGLMQNALCQFNAQYTDVTNKINQTTGDLNVIIYQSHQLQLKSTLMQI